MQMCSLEPWRKIMHTVLVMHIAISRRRVRRKKYIDDNEVTIFFIYTDVLASSSLQRFWFLQSRYTVEQQLMLHLLIYVCAQFFSLFTLIFSFLSVILSFFLHIIVLLFFSLLTLCSPLTYFIIPLSFLRFLSPHSLFLLSLLPFLNVYIHFPSFLRAYKALNTNFTQSYTSN